MYYFITNNIIENHLSKVPLILFFLHEFQSFLVYGMSPLCLNEQVHSNKHGLQVCLKPYDPFNIKSISVNTCINRRDHI